MDKLEFKDITVDDSLGEPDSQPAPQPVPAPEPFDIIEFMKVKLPPYIFCEELHLRRGSPFACWVICTVSSSSFCIIISCSVICIPLSCGPYDTINKISWCFYFIIHRFFLHQTLYQCIINFLNSNKNILSLPNFVLEP